MRARVCVIWSTRVTPGPQPENDMPRRYAVLLHPEGDRNAWLQALANFFTAAMNAAVDKVIVSQVRTELGGLRAHTLMRHRASHRIRTSSRLTRWVRARAYARLPP